MSGTERCISSDINTYKCHFYKYIKISSNVLYIMYCTLLCLILILTMLFIFYIIRSHISIWQVNVFTREYIVFVLNFVTQRLQQSISIFHIDSQLMCRLAPLIGSEITEKVFLRRYLNLCEDIDMMVRRTCATHFGEMCTAVGKEKLFSKLVRESFDYIKMIQKLYVMSFRWSLTYRLYCSQIPTFINLCGDRVWGVRKACVEVMMPVSCCSTPEFRRMLLADILAKHLNDDSKWVRISAFQILGPFISIFAKQFTEVTYNKNGELVYSCKQDNHLRYGGAPFYFF